MCFPFRVSVFQLKMERAEFLLRQAFEQDEGGNEEEAVELYMQAAELCLTLVCTNVPI